MTLVGNVEYAVVGKRKEVWSKDFTPILDGTGESDAAIQGQALAVNEK